MTHWILLYVVWGYSSGSPVFQIDTPTLAECQRVAAAIKINGTDRPNWQCIEVKK